MSGKFNRKCKSCTENNRWEECKKLIEELLKKYPSIYQYCNGDLNKFVLLLRKGVFPYEDMDSWENFDETTLPPKEAFYSNLENISNEDYAQAQKVWEVFEWKSCGEYHDLYVQSDDKNIQSSYIEYLDVNNLYGWAVSQKLPVKGLKWINQKKKKKNQNLTKTS